MNWKYVLLLAMVLIVINTDVTAKKKKPKKTKKIKVKKFKYKDALKMSILFYEAQRSGHLPDDNRIKWRGDSALDDGKDVGLDLTGGYYDAGDHVKFGLPMAWATTVLAWGVIDYAEGYEKSKQMSYVLDSLRWSYDYFIKAHPEDHVFYGQVGNATLDHMYWGRPEDMTMERPAAAITEECPGSDLAGQTAAALAAGYIVFKDRDADYANLLLEHARVLYEFAYNFQGAYHNCMPHTDEYYPSKEYSDELAWGALWLYRATDEQDYLDMALENYKSFKPYSFTWSNNDAGNQVLLYQLTGDFYEQASDSVRAFVFDFMPGGTVPQTPKGLACRQAWGSLRHAASVAFLAIRATDLGIMDATAKEWAISQIQYMLGSTGQSFVVGYGKKNCPLRYHHRASSCPKKGPCNWATALASDEPNPHILYGALVGGPDLNDVYDDSRRNYVGNEVAVDYNAGFQSALAALTA